MGLGGDLEGEDSQVLSGSARVLPSWLFKYLIFNISASSYCKCSSSFPNSLMKKGIATQNSRPASVSEDKCA